MLSNLQPGWALGDTGLVLQPMESPRVSSPLAGQPGPFLTCSGFSRPCSIQVFHCLKHEGTGGRTLLVDGFHAAEQVLRQAPEQFELLSKVPLKHEYVEKVGDCHNHMIGVGPVLNVYPWNNELYLIRYRQREASGRWGGEGLWRVVVVF